jgi:DNA mismatch repair protein MutS
VNVHVSAAEKGHDIVFLHEIQSGPASRSYGIQVAKLAGVPAAVVHHARHALAALETQKSSAQAQVDLFAAPPDRTEDSRVDGAIESALRDIQPDTLSPREALDMLYQLKKLIPKS